MLVIGITGIIGSGKSTLASIVNDDGFKVYNTDALAKQIIDNNESVRRKLLETFGKETFLDNGNFNTDYLSALVFDSEDDENLLKLNNIIHPQVIEEMIELTKTCENSGDKAIFFESALIFEAGLEEGFDYIITVISDLELIIERLENKISRIDLLKRVSKQISQEEKAKNSDFVIENNGSTEDLKKSARFIMNIIMNDLD